MMVFLWFHPRGLGVGIFGELGVEVWVVIIWGLGGAA